MKIGVFDSGYGGLSILKEVRKLLPQYDYIYLGDNARSPYGTRSFEVVYRYTLQCVQELFKEGCQLIIIACNTASAKALRTIQQHDLPLLDSQKRVLGVIRPTVEIIGGLTRSKHVGLLSTLGTVRSESYPKEIFKLYPEITVTSSACPMWVPLIEYGEYLTPGADYFIKKDLDALMQLDQDIDTVILGCTHYPLIKKKVFDFLPPGIKVVSQGVLVAKSLEDYLRRHPELERVLTQHESICYLTTECVEQFQANASLFLGHEIQASTVSIG